MLTQEMNERLTRVGPGTPMGELMRRYWHPIAGSAQIDDERPTKEVRLLGEDLVLFRSAAGKLGLIEPSCAHRKANLSYEPINVHRDPVENEIIVLPVEGWEYPGYEGQPGGPFKDIEVGRSDVEAVLSGEGAQLPEWR